MTEDRLQVSTYLSAFMALQIVLSAIPSEPALVTPGWLKCEIKPKM